MLRQVYGHTQRNTAVAASGSETITPSKEKVDTFGPCNFLDVTNNDSVDIELRLDGSTTDGRVFQIPATGTLTINPEDGLFFSTIVAVNLSAAAAETADKITYNIARKQVA